MTSASLATILQISLILLSALTALKLLRTGLHKRYRVFFYFLVFRACVSFSTFLIHDTSSALYFHVFVWTTPIVFIFYVLIVAELYRLVLEKYRGLYTMGRWVMFGSVIVSMTISVLSLLPKLSPATPQRSRAVGYIMYTERGVDTALAVFIVLILLFLSFFPIRLSRNTRVHAVIYSVFFLSSTVALLLRTYFGMRVAATVNTMLLVLNLCSVLAWLALLNPAGEEVAGRPRMVDPANESRLLTQLESLNATLLRVSRQQVR
jgi:hypothetical protein